jgi:hypothetical protein
MLTGKYTAQNRPGGFFRRVLPRYRAGPWTPYNRWWGSLGRSGTGIRRLRVR